MEVLSPAVEGLLIQVLQVSWCEAAATGPRPQLGRRRRDALQGGRRGTQQAQQPLQPGDKQRPIGQEQPAAATHSTLQPRTTWGPVAELQPIPRRMAAVPQNKSKALDRLTPHQKDTKPETYYGMAFVKRNRYCLEYAALSNCVFSVFI